jgi:hypothetical protein
MKKVLSGLILGLLVACNACTTMPTTPAQAVFAAKTQYAAALTVAVAYKRLPRCTVATPPCSDLTIVTRLQKADDAASALLDGAEITVRAGGDNTQLAITAAQQAVAAFTSITKTLEVK